MTHKQAMFFSGLIWMVVGAVLLYRGLYYLFDGMNQEGHFSIASGLMPVIGSYEGVMLLLIGIGILLGHLKGRYVLNRTVERVVRKILLKPTPLKIRTLYGKGYYLVIGSMVCVGLGLRFSLIALDTKGFIDVAIGVALITGAISYFKALALLNHSK